MSDETQVETLVRFLRWIDKEKNMTLCRSGYASEMLEAGADYEELAREYLATNSR